MNTEKRYPCVADLEAAAMRRIPGFMRDYLINGIGQGVAVEKNRQALNDVELMPATSRTLTSPIFTAN